MKKLIHLLSFLIWIDCSAIDAALDLESLAQDFVLEVKQIRIPGHPFACNPSLLRCKDRFLLSFDAYIKRKDQPDGIGLAFLDDDFDVMGNPQILDLPPNLWQDPRLVAVQERIYLVFNGGIDGGVRRMFIAQVREASNKFIVDPPEVFLRFPGEKAEQWEKNWIPFVHDDTLLLTYSLVPHKILQPFLTTQQCVEVSSTTPITFWNWGTLRPGTTAHLDGDHYLAIFHSTQIMSTLHSEGFPMQHYFMGAYTFQNHPPFAITAISQKPIIGKNFYHGQEYEMIKPCRVVFPCGMVVDDRFIWIVFGRQDHELWMAKLDKKGLYESLETGQKNDTAEKQDV